MLSTHAASGTRRDDVFAAVASTVAEGVGAEDVTLWVGSEHELLPVASWPPGAADGRDRSGLRDLAALGARGDTAVEPILHRGTVRGAVTLTKRRGEALTVTEERLLHDLAAQAGLVIDNVGLGAELQERLREITAQATELQAAAKRLVAAEDEARRRIERDLHDGAQPRLVTLALRLQAISARAEASGDEQLVKGVRGARQELAEALSELREMARGIHPAILTDEGLEAALAFLAERAPLPVHLAVDLRCRPPAAVEGAAYFVVSEALTNVAKHADATKAAVVATIDDGQLVVEVSDDGCGGAGGAGRGGLQGLVDRLATLSGTLTVESPAGSGTVIRAVIPCG
jgi:signal transduction histidine kinase